MNNTTPNQRERMEPAMAVVMIAMVGNIVKEYDMSIAIVEGL